jgi:serpin B
MNPSNAKLQTRPRPGHVGCFLVASLVLSLSAGPTLATQTTQLVQGNTAFALDLYARLKQQEGNLFLSPYSISTCLAMTYAGARGNTEKQMAQVLHLSTDQAQVHSAFGELQRQLNAGAGQKGIELSIANALWRQKGYRPFLPAFLETASRDYDAALKEADLREKPEASAREINQWVAGKTKGRIRDILLPKDLGGATMLVLADAIYFKGAWAKAFGTNATTAEPFHVSKDRRVDVPMMHQTEKVNYTEDSSFQAVELPYVGRQLAMVILLPRQAGACEQLEDALSPANLARWLGRMRAQDVELSLPRFKIESGLIKLNKVLAQMGMRDAFVEGVADFSGLDGHFEHFISSVFHKAWLAVAEEGTEAAAATTVVLTDGIQVGNPRPRVFRADHPFLFIIRDTRTGTVLFLGRLVDPST